jgi:hypothetical protein
MMKLGLSLVLVLTMQSMAHAVPCEEADHLLRSWSPDAKRLSEALHGELDRLSSPDVAAAYCRALADDLTEKRQSAQIIHRSVERRHQSE